MPWKWKVWCSQKHGNCSGLCGTLCAESAGSPNTTNIHVSDECNQYKNISICLPFTFYLFTKSIATLYRFNPVFIKYKITNGTNVISALSQVLGCFLEFSHCMIFWTTYFHPFLFFWGCDVATKKSLGLMFSTFVIHNEEDQFWHFWQCHCKRCVLYVSLSERPSTVVLTVTTLHCMRLILLKCLHSCHVCSVDNKKFNNIMNVSV
jgi:hypothetical protein